MIRTMVMAGGLLLLLPAGARADGEVEASAGADVVSGYIWRGQELGNVALQPSLSVSWRGFTLGAWGSVGLDKDDTKEFDLTLGYGAGGFSVSLTDYWFHTFGAAPDAYASWAPGKRKHVYEAQVGYDFGPVALSWFTNIGGDDGLNRDGRRAYSSYVEASAPFKLGGLDWQAGVGAVPWATTFYSGRSAGVGGFAVTSLSLKATKKLALAKFNVPLFVQAVWNPSSENAFFVVGVSF